MPEFDIDVSRLMQAAGWPVGKASPDQASDAESMTWVAGLVLIEEKENTSTAHRGTGK